MSMIHVYIHAGQEWGRDINRTPGPFETIPHLYNRGKEDYYYLFIVRTFWISMILVCFFTPLFFWIPLICFIPAIRNAKKV